MDPRRNIIIRPWDPDAELPLVMSNWMRSYVKGRRGPLRFVDRQRMYPGHRKVVEGLLERPSTRIGVAQFMDIPEVLGWVCYELDVPQWMPGEDGKWSQQPTNVLHYVYVKEDYRRKRLALVMLRNVFDDKGGCAWFTHDTKVFTKHIRPKMERVPTYSPGLLFYPPVAA